MNSLLQPSTQQIVSDCPALRPTLCGAVNHEKDLFVDLQSQKQPLKSPGTDKNQSETRSLDISPVGIYLDCNLTLETNVNACVDTLRDAILADIKMQSSNPNRRPVTLLWWRQLFPRFSTSDATELTYFLARHFRLNTDSKREYCLEVPIDAMEKNEIALIKGLGFNQLLLILPPDLSDPNNWREIALKVALLRQFDFNSLMIAVTYGDEEKSLHHIRREIDLILSLSADRIVVRRVGDKQSAQPESSISSQQFFLIYQALRNSGWRVLGNDWFVKTNDPLIQAQREHRLRHTLLGYNQCNAAELIGIGPGAAGQSRNCWTRNSRDLRVYLDALNRDLPPIAQQDFVSNHDHIVDMVVADLLCYHRVNIGYYRDRYGFDLEPVFAAANPTPLYTLDHGVVNVTAEGIPQLNEVCASLYHC